MKTKQKIAALLGAIAILSLCILPIATFAADIEGRTGYETGWTVYAEMNWYESGPDITTEWGESSEPVFDLVNRYDVYSKISAGSDRMNYMSATYVFYEDLRLCSYRISPGFGGNNNVFFIYPQDEVTLYVYGDFDGTNTTEIPELNLWFADGFVISSWSVSYDANNKHYDWYNNNYYLSSVNLIQYDEFEPPLGADTYISNLYATITIKQIPIDTARRFIIGVEHSVVSSSETDPNYTLGYNKGFTEGKEIGYQLGYNSGRLDGKAEGIAEASADVELRVSRAYADGVTEGRRQVYNEMGSQSGGYTSWLINAVGGFLNFEIFPGFSLAGIMGILVGIFVVIAFLRYYSGG